MVMEKRKFGNTGIEIGPLVFGGNIFGWTVDEKASFALLDEFVASGCNLIDTADVYSSWVPGNRGGESETIIGNWMKLRGNRSRVLIATKVGSEVGPGRKGLSRAHILRAVEDSLRRLQSDYVDLYQSHRDDPATPVEETLEAYHELLAQGKIRMIGASNFSAERLSQSLSASARLAIPPYVSLQPQYNLYDRAGYETQLEALCRSRGLAVIPYFPLAAGFLSGKYRSEKDFSKSLRGPGIKKYMNERGLRILRALDEVAKRCEKGLASVALAWLLARPGITAPIASATSRLQLGELIAGVRLHLDAESLEELNRASAP